MPHWMSNKMFWHFEWHFSTPFQIIANSRITQFSFLIFTCCCRQWTRFCNQIITTKLNCIFSSNCFNKNRCNSMLNFHWSNFFTGSSWESFYCMIISEWKIWWLHAFCVWKSKLMHVNKKLKSGSETFLKVTKCDKSWKN